MDFGSKVRGTFLSLSRKNSYFLAASWYCSRSGLMLSFSRGGGASSPRATKQSTGASDNTRAFMSRSPCPTADGPGGDRSLAQRQHNLGGANAVAVRPLVRLLAGWCAALLLRQVRVLQLVA